MSLQVLFVCKACNSAFIALIQQSWREASAYDEGSAADEMVITNFLWTGERREYESTELSG